MILYVVRLVRSVPRVPGLLRPREFSLSTCGVHLSLDYSI